MNGPRSLPLVSRREFVATLSFLSTGAAAACSKKAQFSCLEASSLTQADKEMRQRVGYVDTAPTPDRECSRCIQFIEADQGCGTCKILKGPVHPNGTCRSFAANG